MADRRHSKGMTPAGDGDDGPPDRVPDAVVDRAKGALGRRSRGELAALVFDSLVDEDAPGPDQRLRFEHPLVQIEVQVSPVRDGSDVRGRVKPAQRRVELHLEGAEVALVDEALFGTFSFRGVPHGLIRLRFEGEPPTAPVNTDWFRA